MRIIMVCVALCLCSDALAGPQSGPNVNSLLKKMYFRSFVQDDPSCALDIQGKNVSSTGSAVSCPDAFAWLQFAEVVQNQFWTWGLDQTVWPTQPYPLCRPGQNPKKHSCCDPHARITKKTPQPDQCPAYRADYADPSPLPNVPNASPSSRVINHAGLNLSADIDPGRLLRDLELELVFRNKPMVDYIYRHDLYSKEGLGARNRAQNAALDQGNVAKAHALEVRFPIDAVMVKADFVHQDIMQAQNLITAFDADGQPLSPPNNANHPYITVKLDHKSSTDSVPGYYYLVAMTNASKDLPIWHWYAIEHVAVPGRCDYIGCNDSFGYRVNTQTVSGAHFGPSYIPPKTFLNDDKADQNNPLFETGKTYLPGETGEVITPALTDMLKAMGIGTGQRNPDRLTPADPAWHSYRLKGTQINFVTLSGVPSGTGATVTEGGFVNSASCTTCHSQASVDADGNAGLQGVGATWRPNLLGYGQVAMGAPELSWFYNPSGPSVIATQIDFVWGILGAACQNPEQEDNPHGPCKASSYPDAPTIIPPKAE